MRLPYLELEIDSSCQILIKSSHYCLYLSHNHREMRPIRLLERMTRDCMPTIVAYIYKG